MLLYLPLDDMPRLLAEAQSLRFDGKTIVGALAGGYLFGELTKKLAKVEFSTGDALAVALPLGQAIGRVGCFFGGCCYGTACSLPWAVYSHGAARHPVMLYEAALDLALAAVLVAVRARSRPLTRSKARNVAVLLARPPGHLFRYYLIGYGVIRFSLEFLRGEPQRTLGPLSFTQVICLLAVAALGISLRFPSAARHQPAPQHSELEPKRV
jgi:phosphatidylglycerol:prolipoprotein diacylglycerol transferase